MEPPSSPTLINSNLTIHELNVNLFEPVITEENDKKVASIDGILKATLQIPIQSTKRKLLLIVIVDKSRSIQTAWFQIQSTLLNLFSMISNVDQEIILEILFFNSFCYRLKYTKENFRELILNEKPNGKTCFAAAFSMTEDTIKKYYKIGSEFKSERDFDTQTDTAIVLLTDGSHTTTRDHKKAFNNLRNTIDLVKNASIVTSTMGFTPNSRFNDLDGIRRLLGNSPGIYQYSDPSDGAYALQEKLTFILKYVLNSSNTFNLNIKIETIYNNTTTTTTTDGSTNTTTTTTIDNQKSLITFNNETIKSSIKKNYQLTFDQFGIGEISLGINSSGYNISEIIVDFDINGDEKLREIKSIKPTIKNDQSEESKYYTILIGLDSKINLLLNEIERFNATNKPSEKQKSEYLKQIIQYQNKLSEIDNMKLFRIKSGNRSELVELKQQSLNMTSQLLDLINSWDRSEWSTTSNARVADITYRYLFKNTGRQRRMNLKVARNSTNIKEEANKFKDLQVDMDELEDIADGDDEKQSSLLEASKQLFTDVLSLSDWTEALEEKDIMGFGLSIQRPESVIDDPTQIRIQDISTTFICKSSIEDAIALSLEVHGQEKTTGGFEVGHDKQSVAVRGRGREAINSFLPLYLHKEHWKPIKYQLKNIIAYFVTLDPLAFSFDQINALFLVLGTLISKNDIGERELLLAIQFTRTLREVAVHLNFIPRMLQQLDAIVNNPIYLISAQPKNLFVLTSYLLVLTDKELESVFKNGSNDHFKLWQNILESSIRRACYTFFDKMEQTKIDSFLFQILFGGSNEKIQEIDNANVEKEPNELFNLLLNYKFDQIKFNEQQDYGELLNIKKKTFTDDDVDQSRTIKKVNQDMVQSMIRISNLLENRGYPNITILFNSLRYVKTWRSIYKDQDNIFNVIDSRYGIPPTEYIEIMKNGTRSSSVVNNNGIGNFINTINKFYGDSLNFTPEILLDHLRAMIVQAVSYRINRHATFAVVEKKLETSVFDDHKKCILNITKDVMIRASEAIRSMKAILMFSATMDKAARSTTMDDFITTIPPVRNAFFMKFVHSVMGFGNNQFGELKFVVFLSNTYVTCDDYGTISTKKIQNHTWDFGKHFYKVMIKSFGIDKTKQIVQKVNHHIYLHDRKVFNQNDDGVWENN
ncbi:hypothetical protein ACTFIW_005410 [Dictyostelium discoideum]